MTGRILFVCLGNICRSPAAEAVFRHIAQNAGLNQETDSAGTSDWHIGDPPYGPMQAAAGARGYDLSGLRARQLTARDFTEFDLIIGMDHSNLSTSEALRPEGALTPIRLLTEFAPRIAGGQNADHVPDPYYTRDFEGTLDLIEAACGGLADQLAQNASAVSPKFL